MDSPILRQHALQPNNNRALVAFTAQGQSTYPPCGDRLVLEVLIKDGCIAQAGFHGCLCAPLVAMGSLLTTKLQGLPSEQLATIGLSDLIALLDGLPPSKRHTYLLFLDALHQISQQSIKK